MLEIKEDLVQIKTFKATTYVGFEILKTSLIIDSLSSFIWHSAFFQIFLDDNFLQIDWLIFWNTLFYSSHEAATIAKKNSFLTLEFAAVKEKVFQMILTYFSAFDSNRIFFDAFSCLVFSPDKAVRWTSMTSIQNNLSSSNRSTFYGIDMDALKIFMQKKEKNIVFKSKISLSRKIKVNSKKTKKVVGFQSQTKSSRIFFIAVRVKISYTGKRVTNERPKRAVNSVQDTWTTLLHCVIACVFSGL